VPLIVDPTVRLNASEVVLATEEEKELQSIQVYPNPCEGTFTIDISKIYGYINSIEVLNALGQTVNTDKILSSDKKKLTYPPNHPDFILSISILIKEV